MTIRLELQGSLTIVKDVLIRLEEPSLIHSIERIQAHLKAMDMRKLTFGIKRTLELLIEECNRWLSIRWNGARITEEYNMMCLSHSRSCVEYIVKYLMETIKVT